MKEVRHGESLAAAAAAAVGTACHIYDGAAMLRSHASLVEAMRSRCCPRFVNYFAVKALPNPHVLRLLISHIASAGAWTCGLDCSSAAELRIAAAVGVGGERVMFSSNYTSVDDLRLAVELGAIVNLDGV